VSSSEVLRDDTCKRRQSSFRMDADRNFAILIPKNRRTCLAKQDQAGSYVRVATSFMINVLTSNQ